MKEFIIVHDPDDNTPIMVRISSIVIVFGREDDSSIVFMSNDFVAENNKSYCVCRESINAIFKLIDEASN